MDIAKSMRLGGKIVHADECNFNSYVELGLRCPRCGEPVYLKKGEHRKPHFAHIHATSTRQVERCGLRASSYGNTTENSLLIEDRGQRLEIFQKHFLSMLFIGEKKIVDDVEFNNWIHVIKRENTQVFNNITNACTNYFLTHQKQLKEIYISPLKLIKDNTTLLQQQIAIEAMDYLCVKSSFKLLEYVLNYSIYQLYKHEQSKLLRQEITTHDIYNICLYTAQVILYHPCLEAVEAITDVNRNNSILYNWSLPFYVNLNPSDYLFDAKSPTQLLQICLEQDRIVLYKLGSSYKKYYTELENSPTKYGGIKTLIGKTAIDANNKALLQDRVKLIEVGVIAYAEFPVYQWIATTPKYEQIAKSLTKTGNLPQDIEKTFVGIQVNQDTATLGNRIIANKKQIGLKPMFRGLLNKQFTDDSGTVRQNCLWIDNILQIATTKMIQANGSIIQEKLNNNDLTVEQKKRMKDAKHNLKTLLRTITKTIAQFTALSKDKRIPISNAIGEYLICYRGMSRHDILGLMKNLTEEQYEKLLHESLAYVSKKDYVSISKAIVG